MRILLMILVILIGFIARAENKLQLCTEYDANGDPKTTFPAWKIRKTSNFMYVLYKSDTPIEDSLYIFLEKTYSRKDTAYYEYDHYYLVPDASKKFAANKYIFSKPGNYRISVFDRHTEKLLQTYTTFIEFADDEYKDPYYTDTWYYNQAEIYFCDSIVDDKLVGRSDVFSYQPGGNKIMLYIAQQNKNPLKTQHLIVKIFSRGTNQLIKTNSYNIGNKWFWTYLPMTIENKGKYTVEMYNEDDLFVSKADVEIK
ncbi:MAG: hypothetical protein JWN78_703 [Bacteroidota bacterium]|nr:hypothetical protein [Bacteroidota bacterium]